MVPVDALLFRRSPTIPTLSFRFGKRHIKVFSRSSVKKKNKNNNLGFKEDSFASPNLPSQTLKGWDMVWDSLEAGVVSGTRCGPLDSII